MEACLYDPTDGYYLRPGRKTGPGDDADFATSPTMHPFFAQAIAQEIVDTWRRLREPEEFVVVEFGGGEGDLARNALRWLDENADELAKHVSWIHVERSPTHRTSQKGDARITWADAMPDLAAGFVVANEFLDALPFDWLVEADPALEVGVDVAAELFVEALRNADEAAFAHAWSTRPPRGERFVGYPGVAAWFHEIGQTLRRGSVLVVDYGDRSERLWKRRAVNATVRGFRRHQSVESVLESPGDVDITASIDFSLTKKWAAENGLHEVGFETQEGFLLRHGVLDALNAIDRSTRAGASDYLRLRQLLLPTGLGAVFKVQRFEKGLA